MHVRMADTATTLVWIDSEEAIIVRWADRATVERVRSDVPGRHRSSGPDRADSSTHHGGGGGPEAAERARRARLAAFIHDVAGLIPPDGDVLVVGPGMVRERLERDLRADDRRLGRHRHVHAAPAERLTEEELVAHVRELAGEAPKRRGMPDQD
jgi:hypothetical protein